MEPGRVADPFQTPLISWRTHSCVPCSHSCEHKAAKKKGVHKSVNTARLGAQCHLVFPKLGFMDWRWGGPPGPRGSPWTRSFTNEISLVRRTSRRGRRLRTRGSAPHRPPFSGKLSGIALRSVRHNAAEPLSPTDPPTLWRLRPGQVEPAFHRSPKSRCRRNWKPSFSQRRPGESRFR